MWFGWIGVWVLIVDLCGVDWVEVEDVVWVEGVLEESFDLDGILFCIDWEIGCCEVFGCVDCGEVYIG